MRSILCPIRTAFKAHRAPAATSSRVTGPASARRRSSTYFRLWLSLGSGGLSASANRMKELRRLLRLSAPSTRTLAYITRTIRPPASHAASYSPTSKSTSFGDQFPSVTNSAAAPMWMRYSVSNETYGSPEYVFIENSE